MWKTSALFCYILLASVTTFSQTKGITLKNVNLRVSPSAKSNIITVILSWEAIEVEKCNQSWCFVEYGNFSGYVAKRYIVSQTSDKRTSVNNNSKKFYKNSQGDKVQSPTFYESAPQGATAECTDGTYSFSRSRRGTCSHHGGVKRWL